VVAAAAAACSSDATADDGSAGLRCAAAPANAARFAEAKLYFEHNATDEDTGFHGLIDGDGWTELCVLDPGGRQILGAKPLANLKGLGMGTIFWESREPPNDEVSVQAQLDAFPAGRYEIRGTTFDGRALTAEATLTHDIPMPVTITSPANRAMLPPAGLVVRWEPVSQSLDGRPIQVTGYECIVTNEEVEDPHGMSQPILSVHLPPSRTSVTVPDEFLEPDTVYEVEVLALEVSGNQTISTIFFETGAR
jgi:hypothetical protein